MIELVCKTCLTSIILCDTIPRSKSVSSQCKCKNVFIVYTSNTVSRGVISNMLNDKRYTHNIHFKEGKVVSSYLYSSKDPSFKVDIRSDLSIYDTFDDGYHALLFIDDLLIYK